MTIDPNIFLEIKFNLKSNFENKLKLLKQMATSPYLTEEIKGYMKAHKVTNRFFKLFPRLRKHSIML